jgi:hypothetical protein
MTEPDEEYIHIKSRLLFLYDLTAQDYPDWDGKQIKEYIDVGEWDLAADSLAYDYLLGQFEMNKSIFNIFADLAKRMDLLNDEYCPYIRELLSQKHSWTSGSN